ncbi:MAG: SDR family oxidoreductase [Bacillota bacterium]
MLAGKVALVTGSSRGIGRAVALELGRCGADVAVHCRHSASQGMEVVGALRDMGRRSLLTLGDVRSESEVEQVFTQVERELGSVDILVNNAVYALLKPLLEFTVDEWRAQVEYKAVGYYLNLRRALPAMLDKGEGVIINILSTVGLRGGEGEAAYAATNGAAMALTRAVASEFGRQGIRCCGVVLTWAENAFDPRDPAGAAWLERFALGRVTRLEEVAKTVAFLASSAAAGITGTLVPVDAGYLAR